MAAAKAGGAELKSLHLCSWGIEDVEKADHSSAMDERDREALTEWAALNHQIRELLAVSIAETDDVTPAVLTLANVTADLLCGNSGTADDLERQLAGFAKMVSDFGREKFLARNGVDGSG